MPLKRKSSAIKSGLSRPASNLERLLIFSHDLKAYSNFVLISTYSTDLLQNKELVFKSLRGLILKNTHFTLNFFRNQSYKDKKDRDEFLLRPVLKIKLKDVVEFLDYDMDIEVDEDLLKNLNEHYWFVHDANLPLWKVVILNSSTMVFIADRSLFDGESGLQFHKEFLKQLNKNVRDFDNGGNLKVPGIKKIPREDSKIFFYPSDDLSEANLPVTPKKETLLIHETSLSTLSTDSFMISDDEVLFDLAQDFMKLDPIPPSSEELISNCPSFKCFMSLFCKDFSKFDCLFGWMKPMKKPPIEIMSEEINDPLKREFKIINIPDFNFSQIKKKCHQLSISLTVWMTICAHFAFAGIICDNKKPLPTAISIGTRKFINNASNTKSSSRLSCIKKTSESSIGESFSKGNSSKFGIFVSHYNFNYKSIDVIEELVPVAQHRTMKLQQELSRKKYLFQDLDILNNYGKDLIPDKTAKYRKSKVFLSVSNLGLRDARSIWQTPPIAMEDHEEIYIRDLFYSQGYSPNNESIFISTISTKESGLNLVFSMEPEYGSYFGDEVQQKFFQAFLSIIVNEEKRYSAIDTWSSIRPGNSSIFIY